MSTPRLMKKTMVRVEDIDATQRLRPVTNAGVESLVASIDELGLMKDAIHVRQKKDGSLVLIAGGHRLAAAKFKQWEEIEAKVWTDVTDDWARLMEIDDNLAGAEMNALDTAVFLAERKRVYERLHPETKAGVAGAKARWDASDIVSFASSTADKFGLSKRQVERIIAAGSALELDEVRLLRQAPQPVTLKDLGEIAKIEAMGERRQVVMKLHGGKAKSVADARRSIAVEEGRAKPNAAPAEVDELAVLKTAWLRASTATRRRFLADQGAEIQRLLGSASEEAA